MNVDAHLSADRITRALSALNAELARADTNAELCLFGGTVMVLAFRARPATKDVDAIFEPKGPVRAAAQRVAEAEGLPDDWLNDGVKGFVSAAAQTMLAPLPQFSHLRVMMPVPEYLLAMKCMAARIGSTSGDADDTADIRTLVGALELESADAVLSIVAGYYPSDQIPVKTRYLVESLFDEGLV